MWSENRADDIAAKLAALRQKPTLRFAFLPSNETGSIQYFSKDLAADLVTLKPKGYEFMSASQGLAGCDIAVVSAHGLDLSAALWEMQQAADRTLIAVWLWDNHLARMNNLKTALAADLIFPSHWYQAAYLVNPASVLACHVPSCCAQWTTQQARQLFESGADAARNDKLLASYVDYTFSWRSALLNKMKTDVPEAEVILMPPEDRSRYFGKSPDERFREWLSYKASLVLPVQRDLSTRVFDALLAGQVIVVPKAISDFDNVIPPAMQRRLGILRLPDPEIPTIRKFAVQAVDVFNRSGMEGARERHAYAIANHMLVNRLEAMLDFITKTTLDMAPRFYRDPEKGFGLSFVPK